MKFKNIVFSFVSIWILLPIATVTAFAGGQINNRNLFEISTLNSIGAAMRTSFAMAVFVFALMFYIIPLFIFIGFFIHRKFVVPYFGGFFISFFALVFITGTFSIREFAVFYFYFLLAIIVTFFSSTLFNKIRAKKHVFSVKDYFLLKIILIFTMFLLILPIKVSTVLFWVR